MSWKPEVVADSSGKWTSNQLRFETSDEAFQWVQTLKLRWSLVTNTRVTPSDDPVNARWDYTSRTTITLPPRP